MVVRKAVAFLLVACSSLSFGVPQFVGQDRTESPVVVTIGRPNIWSLEQAHYLLMRMQHQNRGLDQKLPQNLDPNAVNGNQIRLANQTLGLSVKANADTTAETNTPLTLPTISDKSFSDVSLSASTQLDSFINFQYEILARQLTLLRDEVGWDERLIFLELPHSIFTTDKKADKRLVQVWWQLEGVSLEQKPKASPCASFKERLKEISNLESELRNDPALSGDQKGLLDTEIASSAGLLDKLGECESIYKVLDKKVEANAKLLAKLNWRGSDADENKARLQKIQNIRSLLLTFFDDADSQNQHPEGTGEIVERARNNRKGTENWVNADGDSRIRTIDLIPRQSSLILNKTYDSTSGLNLSGAFSWLFGLGIQGGYQRQKETFEQYLHQEVYASAFGKGETDFGWTFAPTPGTKRLNPGLRTTFAVAIVPKDAEAISLKAKGCFFRQDKNQPYNFKQTNTSPWTDSKNDVQFCDSEKNFIIPIPNGGDRQGLYVRRIDYYGEQKPGNRIVVSVKGANFSPQVGVLINGVPLRPSVGIAQPFLDKVNSSDNSYQSQDGISGEVEYVASDEIVFAFRMPLGFEGTPTIHLVGPGRTVYLNRLEKIRVNSKVDNLDKADPMFGKRPANDPLPRITSFKLLTASVPGKLTGLLIGRNFDRSSKIYVNGKEVSSPTNFIGTEQLRFDFDGNPNEEMVITIVNEEEEHKGSDSVTYSPSPRLVLNLVSPLSYANGVMVVKVNGIGLKGLRIKTIIGAKQDAWTLIPDNAGQVFLRIVDPSELVEVVLENEDGQTARTVVVRPAVGKPTP